jgi:mannose-6-phosphate isomerase-like protein (cupin superfamily)
MHVNRLVDLKAYEAPGHMDMRMLRMQGRDAGPADMLWLGMSQILPGGGTTFTASDDEKFYVVLEGDLTVESDTGTEVLRRWDSCRIAPGERRALRNDTTTPVIVMLAMPLPQK